MSYPIYSSGSQVQLGSVTWPAACPSVPMPVNIAAPSDIGGGNWLLPVTGVYYWESASASGLILVRSNSLTGSADLALKLISASVYGDASEANDYWADPAGESLRLFTEPGRRQWNCGPAAGALINILAAMSIPARMTQWAATDSQMHQNVEVNLGTEGGWTLYDPHLGLIYADGFDGLDLFTKARAGQVTHPYVRHWQPETPWYSTPWTVLDGFNLAFGLFAASPLPVAGAAGYSEAQIEAVLGVNCTLKTAAQMRTAYY